MEPENQVVGFNADQLAAIGRTSARTVGRYHERGIIRPLKMKFSNRSYESWYGVSVAFAFCVAGLVRYVGGSSDRIQEVLMWAQADDVLARIESGQCFLVMTAKKSYLATADQLAQIDEEGAVIDLRKTMQRFREILKSQISHLTGLN